jgi:hypothetical protein
MQSVGIWDCHTESALDNIFRKSVDETSPPGFRDYTASWGGII